MGTRTLGCSLPPWPGQAPQPIRRCGVVLSHVYAPHAQIPLCPAAMRVALAGRIQPGPAVRGLVESSAWPRFTLHPIPPPGCGVSPRGGRWPRSPSPSPRSLPLGKGAARPGGGISLCRFPCIVRAWVIEEIFQVLLLPSAGGGSPAPFPPLSAAGPYPRSEPRPLKIALCQAIVPTPSRPH